MKWFVLLIIFAPAAFSAPNKIQDQSTYEAVTGESADEDKVFWDSFYKQKDFAFGKDAVSFLKENIHLVNPKGKAFVPAMGEGRNAVFLAKHGFEVIGNDISDVAIDKAMVLAKSQKVSIKASVQDLKQYKFADNDFDFILLSLFIDRSLLPGFKKALKKGGFFMIYLEINEGAPKKTKSHFWVRHNELNNFFPTKEFKIMVNKEYNDQDRRVVGILAKKL